MIFQRKVLRNGLRVISVPTFSESATVMVMIGAGSRYEVRKNSGISHFLEHMAFKGTEKRPTALSISTLIDGIGGEFNAFTSKEVTGYYIKSSKEHVDLSFDILSDMIQNSKLDEGEIDKERGVILEEMNLYEDTPARNIGDVYERLLYGNTPMGWDTAGRKEVIKSITQEDFRSYMGSLYSADNMVLVAAGGIKHGEIEELSEKYFGQMKAFETIKPLPVSEKQKKSQVALKTKKTEQAHLALGVRTVPIGSSQKYALSVLSSILGGGMSSRLFNEVREKRGLAYYVRSHSDHYTDAGTLVSGAGVDPNRIYESIEVMMEQYRNLGKKNFNLTSEELTKAKEFIKGHFVLELEDSRVVASYYAQQEILEGKIENPEEELEKIDKVTMDQVVSLGETFFNPSAVNLAIIGNFKQASKFENLIR